MKYIPNLQDRRTQKRIKQALGFVRGCMSETKPHSWSTRYIDKHLGQNNNSLGNFLRRHLIIETNNRYTKGYTKRGICKEYILNKQGYDYIKELYTTKSYITFIEYKSHMDSLSDIKKSVELLDLLYHKDNYNSYPSALQVTDRGLVHDWCIDQFKTEFDNLDFIYEDKSNRLWHPIQNVRKQDKKHIFSEYGLRYQYDIVCCAPTLIHQYSHQVPLVVKDGKYIQGPMDLYLFAVQRYLQDRISVRKEIANEAQIPEKLVKIIINALFAGAQLGHNPRSAIYKLLNGDKARIEFLKQHQYIIELRSDIKTVWEYLRPVMTTRYKTTKRGMRRRLALSSRDKWNLYFDLERQVLNIIRSYLDSTGNKYFLEHDGFTTQQEVNQTELLDVIHEKTGFILNLDMEILDFDNYYNSYPSVLQVG